MNEIEMPYGKSNLKYGFQQDEAFDLILPKENIISKEQEIYYIDKAFNNCLGQDERKLFSNCNCRIAIAINDLTRPIPHHFILPPLLKKLEKASFSPNNITFFISTGTHRKLSKNEIQDLLSPEISNKYRTIVHNCDDNKQLTYLGKSTIGTPVFINSEYLAHDIRMVIGQIEPHHFMGYSGGVKSAVIGLGGRKTIESNHHLILDKNACMGKFFSNPMRKDIEEIGKIISVDLAFNVVMNSKQKIINAFYGNPYEVMLAGIKASNLACQVNINKKYNLVIASPGGYPKDINFYQSQKAITHACAFLENKGVIILVAECIRGTGSEAFDDYYEGKENYQDVIESFEREVFRIGPHKAYQLALQNRDHHIILLSNLETKIVKNMFLIPANNIEEAFSISKQYIPKHPKIAVLPFATHILPVINDEV